MWSPAWCKPQCLDCITVVSLHQVMEASSMQLKHCDVHVKSSQCETNDNTSLLLNLAVFHCGELYNLGVTP